MDYERKYIEALLRAKRLHSEPTGGTERIVCEQIFPELRMNEDDRMRGAIYYYIGGFIGRTSCAPKGEYSINDMLTWLEKQGIKSLEERAYYSIGDVICDKSCTTLNKKAQPNMEIVDIKNGMYICDKGSFPVSQQDEYELVYKKIDTKLNDDSVSNELRAASTKHAEKELKNHTFPNNEEFELIYTFEEGAKWQAAQKSSWSEKYIADVFEKVGLAKIAREQSNDALTIALQDAMIELSKVTLQPKPTAWSKDDDDNLGMIESRLIDLLSYTRKDNSLTKHRKNTIEEEVVGYVNWLTSLKARFTWKPSNEQMKELNYAVNAMASSRFARENDCCYNVLKTLRDQLEKLK